MICNRKEKLLTKTSHEKNKIKHCWRKCSNILLWLKMHHHKSYLYCETWIRCQGCSQTGSNFSWNIFKKLNFQRDSHWYLCSDDDEQTLWRSKRNGHLSAKNSIIFIYYILKSAHLCLWIFRCHTSFEMQSNLKTWSSSLLKRAFQSVKLHHQAENTACHDLELEPLRSN